jgi:protein TonB
MAFSLLLHGGLLVGAFLLMRGERVALPPVYQVDLVAAPAGPRSLGQVAPRQAPTPPKPEAPIPKRAETKAEPVPARTAPTRQAPAPATRVPDAVSAKRDAPAPKAGGGPTGGTGTDAATIRTEGVVFPFDGYVNNIANQIMTRFDPSDRRALRAEIAFLIGRDGSVSAITFRQRSSSYGFDLEARGAIESAGRARAFGPLPEGFKDDVLPVIFTFEPRFYR